MISFMNSVEETLKNFPHVLQLGDWLSAIATLFVGIISVRLAYQARYSRISAFVSDSKLYKNDGQKITEEIPYKNGLSVHVRNYGPNTIFINKFTSFALKVPFAKHGYDTVILDIIDPQTSILPGNSQTFFIEKDPGDFFNKYFQNLLNLWKENKIKLIFPNITFRYTTAYVVTSDGRFIRAKISKSLKKVLRDSCKNALLQK